MYRIILISHNSFATGLKNAVEMIAGKINNLEAYGLMPGQNPDEIIQKIKSSISPTQRIMIIADIYGGSMCNSAINFLLPLENVTLISGMNLALVIQVCLSKPDSLEAINHVIQEAQKNIKKIELKSFEQESFF